MKIVNAYWEKRNLGVNTLEIEINETDSLQDISQELDEVSAEYIVVKIPNSRSDLLLFMQQQGYAYIEDMVSMVNDLKEVHYSSVMQRMRNEIDVVLMSSEDYKLLFNEVYKGLFSADRISVDPYFTKEQSAQRYVGWIKDEIKKGTSFYQYIYKEEKIGFFGLQEVSKDVYTSFLGGIYEDYRKGGLGSIVKVPDIVKVLGGKRVQTQVSFNNMVQIKSLLMNGYSIEKSNHVFIKHKL